MPLPSKYAGHFFRVDASPHRGLDFKWLRVQPAVAAKSAYDPRSVVIYSTRAIVHGPSRAQAARVCAKLLLACLTSLCF